MTKYFVDKRGNYIGGYAGGRDKNGVELVHSDIPDDVLEVPSAPSDARQKWDRTKWLSTPPLPEPLTAEELFHMIKMKGLLTDADRDHLVK